MTRFAPALPTGIALLRTGVGAALTAFPDRIASAAEGRPASVIARRFTRVVGVRHLTQAVLTLAAPELLTPSRGAVIDGLHGATTMLLAAACPRHRRAAVINTVLAATFCGLGVVGAHEPCRGGAVTAEPSAAHDTTARRHAPPQEGPSLHRQPLDRASGDAGQFALGLQDDSGLYRVKLGAGVLSVLALVAMFVTSLFRAPSIAATVVLAALAVGPSVAISVTVVRRHRTRSPSDG
ncbi:MAG: hypothetical protein WAN20_06010 [Pseudonocardiaceae bacterium]